MSWTFPRGIPTAAVGAEPSVQPLVLGAHSGPGVLWLGGCFRGICSSLRQAGLAVGKERGGQRQRPALVEMLESGSGSGFGCPFPSTLPLQGQVPRFSTKSETLALPVPSQFLLGSAAALKAEKLRSLLPSHHPRLRATSFSKDFPRGTAVTTSS